MVKPDIKHNYYNDLGLQQNASVDDVKKAYRKLALVYHPDRNAGKEEECIPKFQAIQAAVEVLGDAGQKQRYDNDRRKAGLSTPTSAQYRNPSQQYGQNRRPYQNPFPPGTSPFPPPPRRTEPGSYQRPHGTANATNGADRFTNFPRPSPTARKDAAQDRTNMFKAWQNMNNAQERQTNFRASEHASQPQPNPGRGRPPPPPPPPPPRQEPGTPDDEWVRTSTTYRRAPHNVFDADAAEARQSAWASFQNASGGGRPGVARNGSMRTPKKQGFNPNAPGSDERAAPMADSHYAHRHRSADFGRPSPNASSTSDATPENLGPPPRSRTFDDDVPYSEGNRVRTQYPTFIGGKTAFLNPEQLRRSHSSRDTSKLGAPAADQKSRPRSSSPSRRQELKVSPKQPFVVYSSSSSEGDGDDHAPDQPRKNGSSQHQPQSQDVRGEPGPTRPKKTPTPPSRRAEGTSTPVAPTSIPPPPTGEASNTADNTSRPKDGSSNMYADPFLYSFTANPPRCSPQSSRGPGRSPERETRPGHPNSTSNPIDLVSTSRSNPSDGSAPDQAISPSPGYGLKRPKDATQVTTGRRQEVYVTAADELYVNATKIEQKAYLQFQTELRHKYGYVPDNFDMHVFFEAVADLRRVGSTGHAVVDELLRRILVAFPSVGRRPDLPHTHADHTSRDDRFTFQSVPSWSSTPNKSRSAEHINTNFSRDEWNGTFQGAPEGVSPHDFAPRRNGPSSRAKNSFNKGAQRSSTFDITSPSSASSEAGAGRPWNGVDGSSKERPPQPERGDSGFSKEQWEKTFQDPSWTWPGHHAGPSAGSTSASRIDGESERHGADSTSSITVPAHDGDAMDIDTPPAQRQGTDSSAGTADKPTKEARVYSVPPSAWRQQQTQQHPPSSNMPKPPTVEPPIGDDSTLDAKLDDLRNVEPISGPATGSTGLNLSSLSSSLPFQSQPSTYITPPSEPRLPALPAIPVAPEIPSKLTKATWPAYAQHFGAYLKAHHAFNRTMLDLFATEEKILGQQVLAGTEFLEATGDTAGSGNAGRVGFGVYSHAVAESAKIREVWNLVCERHGEAVKKFGGVREQVRRLVAGGGLVES